MSSFIRRIQRMQPHKGLIRTTVKGVTKITVGEVAGRNLTGSGPGSKLGVSNPKDKSRIARLARDKKWGRGQ
ncbi:MAG: hypothetical protein KA233_03145 [Novosphingobium sp.]|nr:hypothetical protein [Novosphingobium sp.]